MQIKNNIAKLGIATLMVLLCYSCGNSTIAHVYHTLPNEGWERDSVLNYDVAIDSLHEQSNIDIELSYNNKYPYRNLYLFVSGADSTDNQIFSDTLNITLADEYGKCLGNGWGTSYQQRVEYKNLYSFPASGVYKITVKQGMRDNPISGIERVGVRVYGN
ncbi:MAG: gliding motility lipoprotein GldH [Muribaculaceae bacterium]|nr:gliding motility lipoprotein GldH [Muribaculaceae bacterium]